MADVEKMKDKIAKLLAKAEGTDNPHEAETFSNAATKMMLRLGIEEAEVRAAMTGAKPVEKVITKTTAEFPALFIKARLGIAAEVANSLGNMRCYIMGGKKLAIVGFESDVDRAMMLIASILIQADHAQATWWRTYPKAGMKQSEAFRARRQFLFSFRSAVGIRIREFYQEAVAEAAPGTALVLRDKQAAVDEEFSKLALRAGRRLKGSWAGAEEGRAAGSRANVGGRGLGGGRKALDR
jgi:Protein of unknown function (DUF2786)